MFLRDVESYLTFTANRAHFTGEASEESVRASYPAATYARLVSIKDRYDPTNLFRLNQNIRPSAG